MGQKRYSPKLGIDVESIASTIASKNIKGALSINAPKFSTPQDIYRFGFDYNKFEPASPKNNKPVTRQVSLQYKKGKKASGIDKQTRDSLNTTYSAENELFDYEEKHKKWFNGQRIDRTPEELSQLGEDTMQKNNIKQRIANNCYTTITSRLLREQSPPEVRPPRRTATATPTVTTPPTTSTTTPDKPNQEPRASWQDDALSGSADFARAIGMGRALVPKELDATPNLSSSWPKRYTAKTGFKKLDNILRAIQLGGVVLDTVNLARTYIAEPRHALFNTNTRTAAGTKLAASVIGVGGLGVGVKTIQALSAGDNWLSALVKGAVAPVTAVADKFKKLPNTWWKPLTDNPDLYAYSREIAKRVTPQMAEVLINRNAGTNDPARINPVRYPGVDQFQFVQRLLDLAGLPAEEIAPNSSLTGRRDPPIPSPDNPPDNAGGGVGAGDGEDGGVGAGNQPGNQPNNRPNNRPGLPQGDEGNQRPSRDRKPKGNN